MTYKKYFLRRIELLTESIKLFNKLSIGLICLGCVLIIIPLPYFNLDLLLSDDQITQLLKSGFGILLMTLPLILKGENNKRKEKILDLKLLLSVLEKNKKSISEEMEKRVLETVLKNI